MKYQEIIDLLDNRSNKLYTFRAKNWIQINYQPLVKNVIKPSAKSILIPLRLTSAAAADAAVYKKILRSGTTTLIISNDEMEGSIKIVKS